MEYYDPNIIKKDILFKVGIVQNKISMNFLYSMKEIQLTRDEAEKLGKRLIKLSRKVRE